MGEIARRLESLGLVLPPAMQPPPGVQLPFQPVRVLGDRAVVSGHSPQNPDGSIGGKLGRVGLDLDVPDGYEAARMTALSMLGSLQRVLGDLDRIRAWVRIFGMVRSAPEFNQQPAVINGCSDLILELFGPEVGAHARSAVGMAELPFGIPVEIEAEVALHT
ncbi:RidA family protein [Micromonospora sp. NPDC049523]|uniref:RidA family protein n=1 Tax=Micromonospora sp. NPDC049523 TaxID=3155921 RepID=UPI0034208550